MSNNTTQRTIGGLTPPWQYSAVGGINSTIGVKACLLQQTIIKAASWPTHCCGFVPQELLYYCVPQYCFDQSGCTYPSVTSKLCRKGNCHVTAHFWLCWSEDIIAVFLFSASTRGVKKRRSYPKVLIVYLHNSFILIRSKTLYHCNDIFACLQSVKTIK